MTRIVRAILIDPFACTVTETEYDGSKGLAEVYALLSHETMPVDLVTAAYSGHLQGRDVIYVDDEGLMKSPQRFFKYSGNPQPLAGKGLIVGTDADGNTISADTPRGYASMMVSFAEALERNGEVGLYATRTPWSAPSV
jgi:hypothetical protein